ncbi:MAG: recombinase family protein [Candidatus Caenarcaniphilales bacterium]|nr:recombinase family protein [Candidatus Caenarcaniphilales bacterium]
MNKYSVLARTFHPSKAPYGYKSITQNKSIVVNEIQAFYVKRAFELYSTGYYSLKTLASELFEEGLVFRLSQPKVRTTELHRILTNKFYTGYFTFKEISRIGHHPPIVSFELFKKCSITVKAS